MDAETRHKMVTQLDQMMTHREESRARLEGILRDFSTRLFAAIESTVAALQTEGVRGLGKPRRLVHPAGGGREGLQIFIEDWSIIFVPLSGLARPNLEDEARIPPIQFKEFCGRIALFLSDDPHARAFYDFIIFGDRSWFAWGYGWPKQQDDIANTDFEALALELIHSFVRDIFVTWHKRADTSLSSALDAKKHPYTFGLPGDDQQGV